MALPLVFPTEEEKDRTTAGPVGVFTISTVTADARMFDLTQLLEYQTEDHIEDC